MKAILQLHRKYIRILKTQLFVFSIGFVLCFHSSLLQAQIEIDDTPTPEELAALLVGAGVTISGVEFTCVDGGAGSFECVDCSLGMDAGIVLTSGGAIEVEGPNNSGSTTGMGTGPGDSDLEDLLPGYTSNDACVLEFDVTVTSDSVKFEYVFGSEEYLEYVGSSFNDVFGFFISGPGIVGTENIALIPGTTIPVSINNVNTGSYEEFYVENGTGFTSPYSTDDYYIQYDGYTTVLTAAAHVTPCETYHLKLAISDMGDGALDSGVFIRAGSLTSTGVTIGYDYDIDGYPELIEGCNNGELTFTLASPSLDTLIVNLEITGTATNGVDYSTIPEIVIFYPGDSIIIVPIEVYLDGITEGLEFISITGELACAISSGDSILIYMNDYFPLDAWPEETTVCPGIPVELYATGANVTFWSPADAFEYFEGDTVIATVYDTTYIVATGVFFGCVATDTVVIYTPIPVANAGLDQIIYYGSSTTLNAGGGVTYTWEPTIGLSDPNISNPKANPEETTTYTVTVVNELGCIDSDSMTVVVLFEELVNIPNAFSPNGDGLNETVRAIPIREMDMISFDIYDRWGTLVFSGTNFSDAWDGTYLGKEQEVGSYIYIFVGVDEKNNEFKLTGTITLLR